MTQRALNQQLFHGTNVDIKGAVLPAVTHGKGSHWDDTGSHAGQASRDHAFATTDESQAWHFANHAAQQTGGRARIYEVGRTRATKPGIHTYLSEYIAPKFPVKQRIDIKPGHQGTFPQVNWNDHQDWENAPVGSHIDMDANHPEPPSHTRTPEAHAEHVAEQQDRAHAKFSMRRDSLGQGELFSRVEANAGAHHSDYGRARAHDVRHLIGEGLAPHVSVDTEMAEAESHDSWNRKKGRRSNAVGRLREKREFG